MQRHISGEQLRPTLGALADKPYRELDEYLGPSRGPRCGLQLPWTTLGPAGITPGSCPRRESRGPSARRATCRAANPATGEKIAGRVVAIAKAIDPGILFRAGRCHDIDTGCMDLSALNHPVTASGYACRQRIGTSNTGRSEHSFANAIDISAFITTDGRTIDVLSGWGPTGRDRRAQALSGEGKNHAGGDARSISDLEADVRVPETIFLRQNSCKRALLISRILDEERTQYGCVRTHELNEARS